MACVGAEEGGGPLPQRETGREKELAEQARIAVAIKAMRTEEEGGTARGMEEKRREEVEGDMEQVLNVEVENTENVTMMELLKAIEITCGRVLGCRAKGTRKWEITMSNRRGKEKLLDGIKIRSASVWAAEVVRDQRVVSFLNLPLYIKDDQIKGKLQLWGVELVSPIRRKKWPGTEIYDGTRYMKVKFTNEVSSLPYSTKFETLEGQEYFRVIHDNQERVCRLCIQPGHILRDCPDFKCYRCGKIGHYARECKQEQDRCTDCRKPAVACTCGEEGGGMEEENDFVSDTAGQEEGVWGSSEMEEGEEEEEREEGRKQVEVKTSAAPGPRAETEQKQRADTAEEREESSQQSGETAYIQRLPVPQMESTQPVEHRMSRKERRKARQRGEQSSGSLPYGQTDQDEPGPRAEIRRGRRQDSNERRQDSINSDCERVGRGGKKDGADERSRSRVRTT